MLLLQLLQILHPLRQPFLCLCHLLRLMIQHDQISILEVEAIQLIACLFRVHDILVHDEGGAFGAVGGSLTDLAYGAEFAEEVEELFCCDVVV